MKSPELAGSPLIRALLVPEACTPSWVKNVFAAAAADVPFPARRSCTAASDCGDIASTPSGLFCVGHPAGNVSSNLRSGW